jgi:hypothetical protein
MASDRHARHDHELEGWDEVERGGGRRPAPGKVPRTLRLGGHAGRAQGAGPAAERAAPGAGGAGALQPRAPGALRDGGDPFALHAVARGGVTGGGDPLPHLAAIHVAEHDEHDDRYTTRGIAIEVHSSPSAGPSSVGCQTVPVDADYDDLIGEIRGSANPRSVYYTLIDASRVEAGLVTVRSGPESPGPSSEAPAAPAAGPAALATAPAP